MKLIQTYRQYLNKLNEGGKAFKDLTYYDSSQLNVILMGVRTFLKTILNLNDFDYKVVGSWGKKKKDEKLNDIDVIVSINSLSRMKNVTENKQIYKEIIDMVVDAGYEYRNSSGIGVISVKYPIQTGKYFQIDLIPVHSMEWGEFSYYSPSLITDESKYKGLYRNDMFEAIAKTLKFDQVYYETDLSDGITKGDVKSYYRYRYLRNFGLYKILEYNVGKRKLKYKKDYDNFTLVSDNPKRVIEILLGSGEPEDFKTFEAVWGKMNNPTYKYFDLLPKIIQNFKVIVADRQHNALPIEIEEYLKSDVEDEYV